VLRIFAAGSCSGPVGGSRPESYVVLCQSENSTQRGANGLKELMPNAKVVNRLATGTTRNWTDKSEWTFVA
jgi:hypothetical protein